MPALINELIDKFDGVELVRDQIAAILVVETARQQELATTAGKDPRLWKLAVFTDRSLPWAQFIECPDQIDGTPIVNVSFDSDSIDESRSNVVERQLMMATFNIDCYGYGVSGEDYESAGQKLGDAIAAQEAQRASRLVRNILMGGAYTYLGFPRGSGQVVTKRILKSRTAFQPVIDSRPVQHIEAMRLALQVDFTEFSPQVQGVPLLLISAEVTRSDTGQVLLTATFDTTEFPND